MADNTENTVKYTGVYKNKIIDPSEIIKLAEIVYLPRQQELKVAVSIWDTEELPKLKESISKHNKQIKRDKSSYFFRKFSMITDDEAKNLIHSEKQWFLHLSRQIYEFDSNFSIEYLSGKTESHINPNFLRDVKWEKTKSVELKVTSRNPESITRKAGVKKTVQVDIQPNKNLISYTVESTDPRWAKSSKTEVEEIIEDFQEPHRYTDKIDLFIIVLWLSTTYLTYSSFYKLNLNDFIYSLGINNHTLIAIAIALANFYLVRKFIGLDLWSSFPKMQITEDYGPFKKSKVIKVAGALLIGSLVNAFYDLSVKFFSKLQ